MRFSDKLPYLIEKSGRTAADIARAAGIAPARITEAKDGKYNPPLKVGLGLARALGVPIEYLADDNLDEPPAPAVTADEKVVLDVLRALALPKDEAIRRLTGHNGVVAVPIDPARPPTPYPDPTRGIGRITGHPATTTAADASKRRAK